MRVSAPHSSTARCAFGELRKCADLLAFAIIVDQKSQPTQMTMLQKLVPLQRTVTLYISTRPDLVVIKIHESFYLSVLPRTPSPNISIALDRTRQCRAMNSPLSSTLAELPRIRRLKYYHLACRMHPDVLCFVDERSLCLCTTERYANCFPFNHQPALAFKMIRSVSFTRGVSA